MTFTYETSGAMRPITFGHVSSKDYQTLLLAFEPWIIDVRNWTIEMRFFSFYCALYKLHSFHRITFAFLSSCWFCLLLKVLLPESFQADVWDETKLSIPLLQVFHILGTGHIRNLCNIKRRSLLSDMWSISQDNRGFTKTAAFIFIPFQLLCVLYGILPAGVLPRIPLSNLVLDLNLLQLFIKPAQVALNQICDHGWGTSRRFFV